MSISPLPPSFQGTVNLSVADFEWCVWCFVSNVLIFVCILAKSVWAYFMTPNEYTSSGIA